MNYIYIYIYKFYILIWSAVEVKIVFKISALCGEYISQHIYKCVIFTVTCENASRPTRNVN